MILMILVYRCTTSCTLEKEDNIVLSIWDSRGATSKLQQQLKMQEITMATLLPSVLG